MTMIAGRMCVLICFFFFSSRRRHTRFDCDWSSDVCSSDLDGCGKKAVQEEIIPFDGCANGAGTEDREHTPYTSVAPFWDSCHNSSFMKNRSEERRVGKECR